MRRELAVVRMELRPALTFDRNAPKSRGKWNEGTDRKIKNITGRGRAGLEAERGKVGRTSREAVFEKKTRVARGGDWRDVKWILRLIKAAEESIDFVPGNFDWIATRTSGGLKKG
jgi:hypothetical protein